MATNPNQPPIATPNAAPSPELIQIVPSKIPGSVGNQILRSAATKGRTDLVGLTWEKDGQIFSVSDHAVLHKSKPTYHKVGLPRYRKNGRVHIIDRRVEMRQGYEDVRTYTVDTYDANGQLVEVSMLGDAELKDMWDKPGFVGAAWLPKKEEPADYEDVPITVGSNGNVFDEISRQLESKNITNWEGLTWENHGHQLEVVKDADVVVPGVNVPEGQRGVKPSRTWLINVTQNIDGETRVVEQRRMSESELSKYANSTLKNASNIRLRRPKTQQEVASEILDARERQMYKWLYGLLDTTPLPTYDSPQTVREKQDQLWLIEDHIKQQTAEWPSSIDPKDKAPIWLLGYFDVLEKDKADKKVKDLAEKPKPLKHWERAELPSNQTRVEALRHAIAAHGLVRICEIIDQSRQEFEISMQKLKLPIEGKSASISWLAEGFADQYFFARHPKNIGEKQQGLNFSDPFEDTPDAQARQREVIDQRVALDFSKKLFKKDSKLQPSGKLNNQQQPAYEKVPVVTIDHVMLANLHLHEDTKKQVEAFAKTVQPAVKEDVEIPAGYYLTLGRILRRTIAR